MTIKQKYQEVSIGIRWNMGAHRSLMNITYLKNKANQS